MRADVKNRSDREAELYDTQRLQRDRFEYALTYLNDGVGRLRRNEAIREAMRVEVRAEFFNAFNHANPEFTNPETIVENTATELGSATFGFPAYTRPPRQIQFALKFYF